MANITIFGKGNMGSAIGGNFETAGNVVSYIGSGESSDQLGDIVVLAVPYSALSSIVEENSEKLAGKVVIDITNPLDFATFDSLVVPSDSSAAAEVQKALPNSKVLKAFNTTFAGTLTSKTIGDSHPTTVLVAGDDTDAKNQVFDALGGSGLATLDAGSLKRARELEALGFLQLTLAGSEKISWNGGFGLFN
ncbi:NADPH-dependent F420 reductase [Carnobacterium inhibens]|uniref:NADPH-dependent F420 reductase n=1 Tax=Carnobacterium inhibens TaxID=147709 RepID=UPI00203C986C|nr:NADPH-dependent F420 reductase [Carnobacterium inhibens]MCM3512206.1 NADPH-dependent F420 reductase [Carnobacterium inhibens]